MAESLQEILQKILPAQRLVYTAKQKPRAYCTFQRVTSTAALNADDQQKLEKITYRVTVFCKGNYEAYIRKIKDALTEAGYYINSTDGENYEQETGYYMCPLTVQTIVKE